MQVVWRRRVPYPRQRVLSQYFDLEHARYVHPRSLGESRLVSCAGNSVWFEQQWPRRFCLRFSSVFRLDLLAPNRARFRVVRGLFRGSQVSVILHEQDGQTLIEETYDIASPLPSWSWLERMVRSWLLKKVDAVWKEDLDVGLPHGGWPGVPRTVDAELVGARD